MPTYTITYFAGNPGSDTAHPLPLVDHVPDPPPSGDFSNYEHSGRMAKEITSSSDTVAFSITAPSGETLGEQTAQIALTTTAQQRTVVEWSVPTGAVRIDVTAQMTNTELNLIRAVDKPLVPLKVTVKKP